MKVSSIESSRGNTPIVSIRRAEATVLRIRHSESLLRSSHSFSPASPPSLFFLRLQSLSPNALTLTLVFFLLFVSLLFFPLFRFRSTSLSLGYFTIRPPADIKLHKQRDAPEELFALQQIFSDCSRATSRRMYGVRVAHYATHY